MNFDKSIHIKTCDFLAKLNNEIISLIDKIDVNIKEDNSPVTNIDFFANKAINDFINSIDKDAYIVSEENKNRISKKNFWIIDPIDGTKSLIKGKDTFSTNIAYIENNRVVFGAIGLPCYDEVYLGDVKNKIAFSYKDKIIKNIKTNKSDKLKIVISNKIYLDRPKFKNDMSNFLNKNSFDIDYDGIFVNSSIKFLEIAKGNAHFYPRFGSIHEWDIAAGHGILRASEGEVYLIDKDMSLKELLYGKEDFLSGCFLALNKVYK